MRLTKLFWQLSAQLTQLFRQTAPPNFKKKQLSSNVTILLMPLKKTEKRGTWSM